MSKCPICGRTDYRTGQICPALGINENNSLCTDCCKKCKYHCDNSAAFRSGASPMPFYCSFSSAPRIKKIYDLKDEYEKMLRNMNRKKGMAERFRRRKENEAAELIERFIPDMEAEMEQIRNCYNAGVARYNAAVKRRLEK